jgi:hypothetical protein
MLGAPEGHWALALPHMPWSDWQISAHELEICKRPNGADWELGSGAFGKVYKAMRNGSQPVAVKLLHETEEEKDFGNEIAILKNSRHSNIVQFQVCCCVTHGYQILTSQCSSTGGI